MQGSPAGCLFAAQAAQAKLSSGHKNELFEICLFLMNPDWTSSIIGSKTFLNRFAIIEVKIL